MMYYLGVVGMSGALERLPFWPKCEKSDAAAAARRFYNIGYNHRKVDKQAYTKF